MGKEKTRRKTQIQFTPAPELRQVIVAEARARGLSISALVRTTLLDAFREQIQMLKQSNSNGSK